MVVTNEAMGLHNLSGMNRGISSPFTINQGKPLLSEYSEYLNYTVDRGYYICGYNSPWGNKEHATNKTTTEVAINAQNDALTTEEKKWIQTHQYNRLFKMILHALGQVDGDCEIEIHGMSIAEKWK